MITLLKSLNHPISKSLSSMLLIAFLTIYWSAAIRFKRNLRFLSAICTSYSVHLSRLTVKSSFSISIHIHSTYFTLQALFQELARIGNNFVLLNNMHWKTLNLSLFPLTIDVFFNPFFLISDSISTCFLASGFPSTSHEGNSSHSKQ